MEKTPSQKVGLKKHRPEKVGTKKHRPEKVGTKKHRPEKVGMYKHCPHQKHNKNNLLLARTDQGKLGWAKPVWARS